MLPYSYVALLDLAFPDFVRRFNLSRSGGLSNWIAGVVPHLCVTIEDWFAVVDVCAGLGSRRRVKIMQKDGFGLSFDLVPVEA